MSVHQQKAVPVAAAVVAVAAAPDLLQNQPTRRDHRQRQRHVHSRIKIQLIMA
jgi:hypothetical protein